MFEELHLCAYGVARHRNAPFADERARYLSYCADRGDALATLQSKANRLVYIARWLSACPNLEAAIEQLKAIAHCRDDREYAAIQRLNTRWTQERFIRFARPWLRFLGWWREPVVPGGQLKFLHLWPGQIPPGRTGRGGLLA
jgi:integrase/recombinase XerD